MKRFLYLSVLCLCLTADRVAADPPGKIIVQGLENPFGVAVGADGRTYVTLSHKGKGLGRGLKGSVIAIENNGKVIPFADDIKFPKGIVAYQDWLFVAAEDGVWRIDLKGNKEVFAAESRFPLRFQELRNIALDPADGTLYVCAVNWSEVAKKGAKPKPTWPTTSMSIA